MASIKIKKLGPIKEIELDLTKNIDIVIGPQATGKSTVAKIIYFCKMIRFYFIDFLNEDSIILNAPGNELYLSFLKYIRKKYMDSFGTTKHMSRSFKVVYNYCQEAFVKIELDEQGYVKFCFSKNLESEIKDSIGSIRKLYEDNQHDKYINAYSTINNRLLMKKEAIQHFAIRSSEIFMDDDEDIIYIPAGRSLLSVLSDQLDVVNTTGLDLSMRDFINRIRDTKIRFGTKLDEVVADYVKTIRGQIKNTDVELAKQLVQKVLKAEYVNDADGEKLFVDDRKWVKLIYGSSGQQEALWIVLLLFIIILENKKTYIIVEEPEAHLFPNAQLSMMELLALTVSSTNSHLFITTHSPYIMTAANLLLYSGKVENNIKQPSNRSIVARQLRIAPQQVDAFKFSETETGIIYNIIDLESGLINASEIDTISDVINDNTEKLIDMEIQYDM